MLHQPDKLVVVPGVTMIMLFAAVLSLSASAAAASLADTVATIKPSIVAVGTMEQDRIPEAKFIGTGFVVGDGSYVVTNEHVVPSILDLENLEKLVIFIGKGKQATSRIAEEVAFDHQHDLALLKMAGPHLPAMRFADSGSAREGDSFAFTGFPIGMVLGLYPVTHRATLSSITPIVIPAAHASDLGARSIRQLLTPFSVFQLDGTAYPGNSGSPLYYSDTGKVVGIVNMVFVKSTKENVLSQPSGIAYAIPGNYIVELIRKAGVTP